MNQKSIIAVLGVVVVILIGTTIYFATINKSSQPVELAPKVVEQAEPAPATQQSAAQPTAPTTQPAAQSASVHETANWQTYSNSTYGFEFKYPKTWRKGGDENMAYVAGNWYTLKPGSSVLLCLPPDGCQDSTIRISAIENIDVDSIISLLTKNDQREIDIQESKFVGVKAKTLIFNNEWKEIVLQRGNVTYLLSGPIKTGRSETDIFEKILSIFKFTN